MPAIRLVSSSAAPSGRFLAARRGSADMTSVPHDPATVPEAEPAGQSSRVHLKPSPSTKNPGYVDGAWWPRSRDLSAELPGLFTALAERLGVVARMAYNLDEWQPAACRIESDGASVRLGGFHYQGANTVDVTGADGVRVTLLVVPPDTAAATARKIAKAAADESNVEPADTLLARVAGRNGMPQPRPVT
jgi:uncharacterized protein DUF5994